MEVDDKSWKILSIIQREGRVSLKSLAETVGLSLPAASERLKRLEEAGVISGYGAKVVPEHVGYGITAIVGMTAVSSLKQQLIQHLSALPEVLECLHVTG